MVRGQRRRRALDRGFIRKTKKKVHNVAAMKKQEEAKLAQDLEGFLRSMVETIEVADKPAKGEGYQGGAQESAARTGAVERGGGGNIAGIQEPSAGVAAGVMEGIVGLREM